MNFIIAVKPCMCTVYVMLNKTLSIQYVKNDLALPKNIARTEYNFHMTYLINTNMNTRLSISCNAFDIVMIY